MKKQPNMLKPLKAYSVQGNEYGVIAFAASGVVARREGANELNIEFEDVESCTRMPGLDEYAGVKGGVPMKVLVEQYGWSQECGYCESRVYADADCNPCRVWVSAEQVCCTAECAEKREQMHAAVLGENHRDG